MPKNDSEIRNLVTQVVENEGLFLWGLEWTSDHGRRILRIYIDSPEGVTLDSCVMISKLLSTRLDVEDIIQSAYSLEVSSPGLERPLFLPEHFRKFSGKKIRFKLVKPLEGNRRNYTGIITSVTDDDFDIDVDGKITTFNFKNLANASLIFEG
ncbi:MAG: ribosome maturation factor RimP [Deltaproteobacteria bacterium]|nr:ribosome maturation factor RimP [Deltaproteobacteria bacterium]